ncbi:uncharacterized protein LOC133206024 [Saccostrea echinata]|uniref:uncharacterized protein LOC133206024 n=1 Tax=Saccostrea echinata TaxID=191078 RepID=UPI002A836A18|nr:uncharacterized protein LOC133206024 [Saccostrea echinata]
MGITYSSSKGYRAKGYACPDVVKCYPSRTYKKFPVHKVKGPGELIQTLRILPNYSVQNPAIDAWWTFCQFFPNNDNILFSTSSPFQILHGSVWKKVSAMPCGKVMQYNLEGAKCGTVPQATCEGFPKLQISPDGVKFTTLSTSSISEHFVLYKTMNPIIKRAHDPSLTQYKDYATSPNGSFYAILAKTSSSCYTFFVFGSCSLLHAEAVIKVDDLYPTIKPPPLSLTERTDIKWSPDSRQVAVGLSRGQLIVIDWRKLQGVCSVFEDVISDYELCGPSTFDFDPRSQHCVMAVAANDMILYRINTDEKKRLGSSDNLGSFVDCLKYSYDANCIVTSLFNLRIKVLDADELCVLFEINLTVSCPDFMDVSANLGSIVPNVTCLAITATGEQVAIACWDRKIRILQLPKVLNLQCMCKYTILSVVNPSNIMKLPLPHLLKDYLYSLPFNP